MFCCPKNCSGGELSRQGESVRVDNYTKVTFSPSQHLLICNKKYKVR
jgi:hypothetical protein